MPPAFRANPHDIFLARWQATRDRTTPPRLTVAPTSPYGR